MIGEMFIFWLLQVLIFLLGISIGHSMLNIKIQREKNKAKALEIALLEKRQEILVQGKKVACDLEEVLYKAKVQQEIDGIIRSKNRPSA